MDELSLCLDTSVLIAFLKGRESGASAVERAIKNYACITTAITVYELLFGVARAQREIGEDALLDMITVLPLDGVSARRAARLHADLIRGNEDVGIKDVLIAAICLEHSLPILTLNDKHFNRVAGLKVFTPENFLRQ
ncbi:MAG: type II toxin-antitoxin system VapC family toxin [Chloroflexi bacterium]|nr:type II toxin-antitoxin system VapC family toxin [Chloroflexota bacterium]MBI5349446.1 type II toxin-antitoxin system VapC family toxin [Chloroflexota bacterium]